MKVAIHQCGSLETGLEANVKRIDTAAARAAKAGADLIVFPELMTSGYNPVIADRPDQRGAAAAIARIAGQRGIAIACGRPEHVDGKYFNAAVLADRAGRRRIDYRKTHLFGDDERRVFAAGDGACETVDLDGWRVGLLVCYDVEFPEAARALALAGADLILVPTALMSPYDQIPNVLIPARAYENQCYVAYANYCGEDTRHRYCGRSTLAGPDGRIIVQAERDETFLVAELSRDALEASRGLNTYLDDRRPATYRTLVDCAQSRRA